MTILRLLGRGAGAALALALFASTTGCGTGRSAPPAHWAQATPPPAISTAAVGLAPAPPRPSPPPGATPSDPWGLLASFAAPAAATLSPASTGNADPCAPFQAAPLVWIAPPCKALVRTLASSPAVPVRASLQTGGLPLAVDLRTMGLDGPVKDQALVGVCWSFAVSTLIENGLRRMGRREVVAPLHVLSSNVWDDLWSARASKAITTEPSWPYVPAKACKLNEEPSEIWCEREYHVRHGSWRSDPELVAEVGRADAMGFVKTSRAQKLHNPVDPSQVAAILATGQAVYAGIDYNRQAWGHQSQGGAEIPDWSVGEGGHGVALVGYRTGPAGRQFLIHNSWSERWRDGGYAWISEAMLRRFTMDAFTVEVSPRGLGAPGPITLPELPGAACGAGQVRDVVLGVCTKPCPGGGAPAASICAPAGLKIPQGVPARLPLPLPLPAPSPPPGPATGPAAAAATSCAAGQSPDVLTRACAARCPSGLPRAGGVCLL